MKILVTGAGTLIGNEICKFLLKKKHSIYASYRYTYPKNLDNTKIKLIKYNLKNNLNLKKNFTCVNLVWQQYLIEIRQKIIHEYKLYFL